MYIDKKEEILPIVVWVENMFMTIGDTVIHLLLKNNNKKIIIVEQALPFCLSELFHCPSFRGEKKCNIKCHFTFLE